MTTALSPTSLNSLIFVPPKTAEVTQQLSAQREAIYQELRARWADAVEIIQSLSLDIGPGGGERPELSDDDHRPSQGPQTPAKWEEWLQAARDRIPKTPGTDDRSLEIIERCLADIQWVAAEDRRRYADIAEFRLDSGRIAHEAAQPVIEDWARAVAAAEMDPLTSQSAFLVRSASVSPGPFLYGSAARGEDLRHTHLGQGLARLAQFAAGHREISPEEARMLNMWLDRLQGEGISGSVLPAQEVQQALDTMAVESFSYTPTSPAGRGAGPAEPVVRLAEGNSQHSDMPWPPGTLIISFPGLVNTVQEYLEGPNGDPELLERLTAARVGPVPPLRPRSPNSRSRTPLSLSPLTTSSSTSRRGRPSR